MKTVGIIGGTGFTGRVISKLLLEHGYEIIIFTRNPKNQPNRQGVTYAQWDAVTDTTDIDALKKIDAAINLAGAGIADKRWTSERKKEILESRVSGTKFLIEQLKLHGQQCKTFISASATGFYGPDQSANQPFREGAAAYPDFLGDTCKAWEAESLKGTAMMRTVILRFGIVLGKESGAFPKLAAPLNFGIMPILGSGKQIVSWIHVADIAGIVQFAIENDKISGIYNAVAPQPVTHKKLMETIAHLKGGSKIPVPAPAFILKIMLGEMSNEVLKSCNASAGKMLNAGYKFKYPDIVGAVRAIVSVVK